MRTPSRRIAEAHGGYCEPMGDSPRTHPRVVFTRRGLATGKRPEIGRLAPHVTVAPLTPLRDESSSTSKVDR